MANAQALQAESRVAVLVDCDNTSPEVLEHALRVVAQFGRVVLRRGYGNHATLANKWQEALVRLAYDGFMGVWNSEKLQPLDYSPLKVYSITDRPVYRPGHAVKFRLWTRKPRFDADDNSYPDKACWVQIRNPKGDIVYEVEAKTDRWAEEQAALRG